MLMKSYNIAVIGGDGTGPEVVREAVKVLDAAGQKFKLKLNYTAYDLGGERYLRTEEALPDSVVEELRKFPGHPPRRHRPSRRQAGHSGKGHSAAPALRAGTVHQLAPGQTLRRRASARSRTRSRRTLILSWSAKTTRGFTPGRAGSFSKARPTKSPFRKASTPAGAWSAAFVSPLNWPANGAAASRGAASSRRSCRRARRPSSPSAAKPTS